MTISLEKMHHHTFLKSDLYLIPVTKVDDKRLTEFPFALLETKDFTPCWICLGYVFVVVVC